MRIRRLKCLLKWLIKRVNVIHNSFMIFQNLEILQISCMKIFYVYNNVNVSSFVCYTESSLIQWKKKYNKLLVKYFCVQKPSKKKYKWHYKDVDKHIILHLILFLRLSLLLIWFIKLFVAILHPQSELIIWFLHSIFLHRIARILNFIIMNCECCK